MLAAHSWKTANLVLIQISFALQNIFLRETMSICTIRLILLCTDWSWKQIQHVPRREVIRFASCECYLAWYSSLEVTWVMWCHDLLLMSLNYFKKIDLFFNGSNHSLKPIYLSKSIHEIFFKMVKQHLFLDPYDLLLLNKNFKLVLLCVLLMSLLTVPDRSWEHSLMK